MSETVMTRPGGSASATPTQVPTAVRRVRHPGVLMVLSCAWLGVVLFMAVFGGIIGLPDYAATVGQPSQPPAFGDLATILGTDSVGRSVLARLAAGAQVSGLVGIAATALAVVVGGALGLISAYFRRMDQGFSVLIDTLLAVPPLILLMAIAAVMEQNLTSLTVAFGVLAVPAFARITKANALQALGQEYVTAARAMGASTARIVVREVLPNTLVPVISFAVIVAAVIMVAEGSLSFLGLGIPPPTPSWGSMIAAGQSRLATESALVFVPATALFLTVFSLNALGDALRARLTSRD